MLTVSICSLSLFTVFVPLSLPHTQSLLTHLSLFIICSFFPFAFWLYDSLYAYGLSLLLISASLYSLCSSCFSLSGFLCLSSSPITSWKCAGHFIDIADLRAKKGGYIKAGGPNGFFLLNFYTLTTFFFYLGRNLVQKHLVVSLKWKSF